MEIIKSPVTMQRRCAGLYKGGRTLALVPTMGALHAGHLSLLDLARAHADTTVMSVFVNPTQFGPKEDFGKYPRPFDRDAALAAQRGCDILFAPEAADMYGPLHASAVEVGGVTELLCGASRPGHFKGVATVVCKLFNLAGPCTAVFGQKDAQQVIVIKRMVDDLFLPVKIVVAPTMRESDGLAMSSRNAYLTPEERVAAPAIFAGLSKAVELYGAGERSCGALTQAARAVFGSGAVLKEEYVEIVDTARVRPVERIDGPALMAVAFRTAQSNTRLIDNVVLGGAL